MRTITSKEISLDLETSGKPTFYSNHPVPLNDLSDRNFEILLYNIFRERLKTKDKEIVNMADNVSLMQGVGEQGRDIILSKNGKNTVVIQCKKHKSNLSRPEVCYEILKFIVCSIKDKSLIGNPHEFKYYIAVSTGFAGTAIGSFNDFGSSILNDPKIKEWVEDIFKDYNKKFKGWKFKTIENELQNILSEIKIDKIVPQDIEFWLSEHDVINKMFFKVLTVTDNTLLDRIINNYLKPILQHLNIPEVNNVDFSHRFKEYLKNAYEIYSSAKTLVFGNQQKKLEDIYYPLSIIKKEEPKIEGKRNEVYRIDKFHDDFIFKYKKIVIIDEGGMGKSTLLKWLFLSSIKQNKAIPIFIELRNLDIDNKILDEITNKLNPLNPIIEKNASAQILSEKGFIFFLDGYDEIKFENREDVTKNLQAFISKCPQSYFIITSRPEKALLSFSDFQEFNVIKLLKNEAFDLIKKLDNYQERSQRLIEQIEKQEINDIDEFLGNPLLVSLLYKKFEYRESIPFKKQEFFYEVFEALFQAHDLSKGDSYIREKESKLSLTDFFQILRGVGFYSIKEGLQFTESQLLELINKAQNEFSKKFESTAFLNDLVRSVPLFQKDGLTIKWAHKSIQQYFAAEYICRDSKSNQEKILLALYKSERVQSYDNLIQLCSEIDFKSFRNSILYNFCQSFIKFYESSFFNLKKSKLITLDEIKIRVGFTYLLPIFFYKKSDLSSKQVNDFENQMDLPVESVLYFYTDESSDIKFITDFNYFFSYNLKNFIFDNRVDLLYRELSNKDNVSEIVEELALEQGRVYSTNDDNVLEPLNQPSKFKLVNKILQNLTFSVDFNKATELIEAVDKEVQNSENHDITAGF